MDMRGIFEPHTPVQVGSKNYSATGASWRPTPKRNVLMRDQTIVEYPTSTKYDTVFGSITRNSPKKGSAFLEVFSKKVRDITARVSHNYSEQKNHKNLENVCYEISLPIEKETSNENYPGLYISNLTSWDVLKNPKSYIDRKCLESRNIRARSFTDNAPRIDKSKILPSLQHSIQINKSKIEDMENMNSKSKCNQLYYFLSKKDDNIDINKCKKDNQTACDSADINGPSYQYQDNISYLKSHSKMTNRNIRRVIHFS